MLKKILLLSIKIKLEETTVNKKGSIAYNLSGSNKIVFNKRNTIMFKQ